MAKTVDARGLSCPQPVILARNAAKDVRVLVVGNPANTNALIAQQNAPDLNPANFTAMTRLDHNRALAQLATKTGSHVSKIRNMTIWGNHSATQYPDISEVVVDDRAASDLVDESWLVDDFIPTVQQRGAAIIKARGASSATSAMSAASGPGSVSSGTSTSSIRPAPRVTAPTTAKNAASR